MNQSWECHKCHSVNAPHLDQCPCSISAAPVVQPIFVPVHPQLPPVYQPWSPNNPWTVTCGDDPNRGLIGLHG